VRADLEGAHHPEGVEGKALEELRFRRALGRRPALAPAAFGPCGVNGERRLLAAYTKDS